MIDSNSGMEAPKLLLSHFPLSITDFRLMCTLDDGIPFNGHRALYPKTTEEQAGRWRNEETEEGIDVVEIGLVLEGGKSEK